MTSVYSKIAPGSSLTVNDHYDFFKIPPTETTELGGTYISAQPSSIADSGSLVQVVVPADDARATNLQESFIMVKGKFVKRTTRANLPAAGETAMKVVAEDNLAHTLFDRCTLSINNEEVFHTSNYPQLAYMRTLLRESKDIKETRLAVEGWLASTKSPAVDFTEISAANLASRKALIANGKEVVLVFRLHTLFDKTSRHLPPNTSLKLILHKASPKSYCLSSEAEFDVDFKLSTLEWFVRRIDLNPAVITAWGSQLVSGAEYILPVDRPRLRTYTINTGVTEQRIVVQEHDTLPLTVAVALVEQAALVGDFTKSQFKYAPHNLSSIELTIDGITVGKRLECNFENGEAAHAYMHSLASLGMFDKDVSNGITYEEFKTNRTVFVWSLTDTHTEGESIFHLKQRGALQVVLRFATAPTTTLSAVILDVREDLVRQNLEGQTHTVETIV